MSEKGLYEWLIPLILFIAAFLVILDQVIRYGVIWQWNQTLHHENIALVFVSFALGMLLSQALPNRSKTS